MKILRNLFVAVAIVGCLFPARATETDISSASAAKLAPKATIYVNPYLWADSKWTNSVQFTVTDISADAVDHIALEYHDKDATEWTHLADFTELSGTYTKDADSAPYYYRIVIHLKDEYKDLADGDCFIRETGAIDDNGQPGKAEYIGYGGASKVIMNTGQGSGTDINMVLLGSTNNGYQIWSCNNTTGKTAYTKWLITYAGVEYDMSYEFSNLGYNDEVTLREGYFSWFTRYIPTDASKYFFFRKFNITDAGGTVFCWDMSSTPSFISKYYMRANLTLAVKPAVYNASDKTYQQQVAWNVTAVNLDMLKNVDVQQSIDGGKTWKTVYTTAYSIGAVTVDLPYSKKEVRYRLNVYPKDQYRVVVDHGYWSSTSANQGLAPTDLSCSVSASAIDPTDSFAYDEATGAKTYQTTLTWNCSDNMKDVFGSGNLQYSIDQGKTWTDITDIDSPEGSEDVKVPVGYTKYLFRINVKPEAAVADLQKFNISAVSDIVPVTYDEGSMAFTHFSNAVKGAVDNYKDMSTVEITYKISKLLWQLSDKSYVSYSFDHYKTEGLPLQAFDTEESGTVEVVVPNNILLESMSGVKGLCTVGIDVVYTIDGEKRHKQCTSNTIIFPSEK